MDLASLFESSTARLISDLKSARSALSHSGQKGAVGEEIVRGFLEKHLPRKIALAEGVAVGAGGEKSRQMDIILYDRSQTPIIYQFELARSLVLPIECCYAAVEVKYSVDASDVEGIVDNMQSFKAIPKRAFYRSKSPITRSYADLYGRDWEEFPQMHFVFAFESGNLKRVAERLDEVEEARKLPLEHRVDMIYALDRGLICNEGADTKLSAICSPGSRKVVVHEKNALLIFFSLLMRYIAQAEMHNTFKFSAYLPQEGALSTFETLDIDP